MARQDQVKPPCSKDLIRQLTGGAHGYHTVAAADERGELHLDQTGLVTLDRLLGYPEASGCDPRCPHPGAGVYYLR